MTDIDQLDDAIIEDTVHCTCCGVSFVLGGNEPYVILDPPRSSLPLPIKSSSARVR